MDSMFCFQCEQTAGGKGCTKIGVCGKTPQISRLQDLLIYQLKGISIYAYNLIQNGQQIDKKIVSFVENSLFTTLTNVNFDLDVHVKLLKESMDIKTKLRQQCKDDIKTEQATYNLPQSLDEMLKDSIMTGIMYDENLDKDIRSLRETITYGLKGISAYGHQARELGYFDDEVDTFYFKALSLITDDSLTLEDLIKLAMETGEKSVNTSNI